MAASAKTVEVEEDSRVSQSYSEVSMESKYSSTVSKDSSTVSKDSSTVSKNSRKVTKDSSKVPKGYSCEFVEEVQEYLLCKYCSLVARQPHITSCCGESFCRTCIGIVLKLKKPCPYCQESKFSTLGHVKNKKAISQLKVYCSLKARGCEWTGPLQELDSHLDPNLNNCQYLSVPCPLYCHMHVPRNTLEDHVAKDCVKRNFICQYCAYQASYEEVVGVHVPQCKYVPVQCPNMCGVTYEREHSEDHMAICRLEEVKCKFGGVGCEQMFPREDEDQHCKENSDTHLSLTASLVLELQKKLTEREERHRQEKKMLEKKLEEQEKLNNVLMNQMCSLKDRGKELEKTVESLGDLVDANLQQLTVKMVGLMKPRCLQSAVKAVELTSMVGLNRTFDINNFTSEMIKNGEYQSPAMYTHVFGHKFFISVLPNGRGSARGQAVSVDVWSLPGEFDDQLKWPARAKFTVELVNQSGGKNLRYTSDEISWARPYKKYEYVVALGAVIIRSGLEVTGSEVVSQAFLRHSDLDSYLAKDSLYFCVSRIKYH